MARRYSVTSRLPLFQFNLARSSKAAASFYPTSVRLTSKSVVPILSIRRFRKDLRICATKTSSGKRVSLSLSVDNLDKQIIFTSFQRQTGLFSVSLGFNHVACKKGSYHHC